MSQETQNRHELSTELAMGGQAVIEGVMMRSPFRVAIAVRKPNQEIAVNTYPYIPITRRIKWLGWPIIRGAVGMVEAMKIGIGALNWAAEQAMPEEESSKPKTEKKSFKEGLGIAFSGLFALAIGLGMFMFLPYQAAKWIAGGDQGQFLFHLIAGGVRVTLLVGYLLLISRFKDIHRIFQYHGSEHKSIFAYEKAVELVPNQVLTQTRFHPRCGTSFLLIVALSAAIFFAIIDSIVVSIWGAYPSVFARFAAHLPLIPVVAGLSFEFLKFSARHTDNKLVWAMIQPGLWLQKITTQEPDGEMCEVAIVALKTAMSKDGTIPQTSSITVKAPTTAEAVA